MGAGAPAFAADDEELVVQADRTRYDDTTGRFEAEGHVVVDPAGMHIEASRLTLDTHTRKGTLEGPIHVHGGEFDVQATGASFDLAADQASLDQFTGRWGPRAQFAGDRLVLGPRQFQLEHAWITSCMAPQPDLRLVARNFRYFPKGQRMNLSGEGVALRVWNQDMVTLPYFNTTFDERRRRDGPDFNAGSLFPSFAFDAYQGFLTSSRFDFSLGDNSRGSVPIVFSTGRGWSAGLEHALDLGPGEVTNGVYFETPWADGRGGIRATNGYAWSLRNGGRLEVDADYRANLNGVPVHRLPDVVYTLPAMRLGHWLALHNTVQAGYLWEETSGQQATRLRWSATCDTPIWQPLPGWRTWVSATPFVNHYIFTPFAGFTSGWYHDQGWGHGLTTSQTVEFNRVFGETPFLHDRQYDAERLRLGLNEDWLPQLTTGVAASWSRINQMGDFSVEDIAVTNTYRWNCFGFSLTLHPLVWGVEAHLAAGMF